MKPILLIDFGSTFTKVTAVDLESEKILGTSKSFTTVTTDIGEGLDNALKDLNSKIGKIKYEERFACSSAAGGLKMVAVGLVPDLTAEAAKRAALSAGSKVMKVFSFGLNKTEIDEIKSINPDIILLTGGTDGGDTKTILHNAEMLSKVEGDFPIVIAGNKSAVNEAAEILQNAGKEVTIADNVMPRLNELNIDSARAAIREIFLKRIIQAKGFTKINSLIKGILMPTPSAVLSAATLLSKGTAHEKGLGELIIIDIGGATTDIHSLADGEPTKGGVVLKGLKEPFAKRTVEGDLGVRYSARSLIDALGVESIAEISQLSVEEVMTLVKKVEEKPELIAKHKNILKELDFALAKMASKESINRHVGTLESEYTPFGKVYVQEGKDLTTVKYIIGTGGPIINSPRALEILKAAVFEEENPTVLKPIKPEFLLDKQYIIAAMGLLGEKYPEVAIRIMKKEIENLL
jgi:uncharacterized protein (TIGR01319 family)